MLLVRWLMSFVLRKLSPGKQLDVFSCIITFHMEHVRAHYLLLCVCICWCVCWCVPRSIRFCKKIQSGIPLIISSPLIMLLCYDMLARVRSLSVIFGVITKRHPWQLITNPVSNDEGSSPVTSIQPRIYFQLWSMRKIFCVNRSDGLFTIAVEVTETQKPKVPLGLRLAGAQMVQQTKSQLQRSPPLFHTCVLGRL